MVRPVTTTNHLLPTRLAILSRLFSSAVSTLLFHPAAVAVGVVSVVGADLSWNLAVPADPANLPGWQRD